MALVLILLLVSSFTVFAEELETLTPTSPPPPNIPAAVPPHHPYSHSPTPTPAPLYPPIHPPHHRDRYHHHPPGPAPVHPPPTPAPANPPTPYHYPPTPVKPPYSHSPTPTPAPLYPPIHPPHHRYRRHHHPPAPAPVHPPPTPYHYPPTPVKPPRPPVHPPVHPFPRSFIAVHGVVYVKSCKYAGVDTLWGATPVLGAIVKLQCNNTKYKVVRTAKTDKNGYFYLEAPKTITTFGAHKCRVVLVSAPNGLKPSNLNGGVTGAILRPEKPYMSQQKVPFQLYAVGPLAFEPKCYY